MKNIGHSCTAVLGLYVWISLGFTGLKLSKLKVNQYLLATKVSCDFCLVEIKPQN